MRRHDPHAPRDRKEAGKPDTTPVPSAGEVIDESGIDGVADRIQQDMDRHSALSRQMFAAAKASDHKAIRRLAAQGASPSFFDQVTGATALHYVAAHGARHAFREILKAPNCDFLMRDGEGRLPSEVADTYGHDPAMARLLRRKEKALARERYGDGKALREALRFRPTPDPKKPAV